MSVCKIYCAVTIILLFCHCSLEGQENSIQQDSLSNIEWPVGNQESIKTAVLTFVQSNNGKTNDSNMTKWAGSGAHQSVIHLLESVPSISKVIQSSRSKPNSISGLKKELDNLGNQTVHSIVALEVAINLVKQNLHDEALTILSEIEMHQVPQPSLGLIYKTICLHQVVELDQAKLFAELLLANSEEMPTRYQFLVDSIYADILGNKSKPLSRVARLMSDAGRRQNLERQTSKALFQEDEIIKSLDKLINDLEKQKKKMRMAADSQSKPSPAQQNSGGGESKPNASGPRMKGDVTSKNQDSDGDWGDLSNEQKAIAVRNLVRELPPHFKDLMNAYFQKLAEEKK